MNSEDGQVYSELGTLEWINFNPDFLIRTSTVETFLFRPNPLFFSLLGYPLIVFSNENISVLSLVVRFSLIGCYSFSGDYSFSYTIKIILQDYVNLEIIKKRGSSINPDIHHSKVFSSVQLTEHTGRNWKLSSPLYNLTVNFGIVTAR